MQVDDKLERIKDAAGGVGDNRFVNAGLCVDVAGSIRIHSPVINSMNLSTQMDPCVSMPINIKSTMLLAGFDDD
jgi:hypothetical protein